jgi:hypothetical protein
MGGLWLTDHDMIREPARTQALFAHARSVGVKLGLGVEITVDYDGKEHHLLGYFPDRAWANDMTPAMLELKSACAAVRVSCLYNSPGSVF